MITHKIIDNFKYKNNQIAIIANNSVFIDIETSGLSPKTSDIVSITFLITENNQTIIYQTFSSEENEEKEILEFLSKKIIDKMYLITYNGNSFDIPYINKKLEHHSINFDLNQFISIDLYKDAINLKQKLKTDNLKLKSIEVYFGIHRTDTLSGKDILALYDAYKLHKKPELRDLILLHNYEDVYYLPIIFDLMLNLYDYIFFNKNLGLIKLNRKNISYNKKDIKIKLSSISTYKLNYNCQKLFYDLCYEYKSNCITITLQATTFEVNKKNYITFIDNKDVHLKSFDTLPKLKSNIVPLIINDVILFDNIFNIISTILKDI